MHYMDKSSGSSHLQELFGHKSRAFYALCDPALKLYMEGTIFETMEQVSVSSLKQARLSQMFAKVHGFIHL